MANELQGVADLAKKLEELGSVASVPILRAAVRAGIKPAFGRAQATIPVGSVTHRSYKGRTLTPGFAKRSLRVITIVSPDKRVVSAVLGVRREAFYASQFVELGTAKMSAKPWLKPALASTQDAAQAALAQKLRDRIAQITGH